METDSGVRSSAPLRGCLGGIAWGVAIQAKGERAVRVSTEYSEIKHGGCSGLLRFSGRGSRRPLKVSSHFIQVDLLRIWLKTI